MYKIFLTRRILPYNSLGALVSSWFKKAKLYPTWILAVLVSSAPQLVLAQTDSQWKIHDLDRPNPVKVSPGTVSVGDKAGSAPSDAVVLFNGADLSLWQHPDGRAAEWTLEDGYMVVKAGTGSIMTQPAFGSCQLHIEWRAPIQKDKAGQDAGNSGVYLMSKYEVQVLNSYDKETYADGQAAALYAQVPPLVNSSLPPGEWQTYDIIFHRPYFDADGNLATPARITLLHNGVLVQDHVAFVGPTDWQARPPYQHHPARLPILLQDHGEPVAYRNIWVRDLESSVDSEEIAIVGHARENYVGLYEISPGFYIRIKDEGGWFKFYLGETYKYNIYPKSKSDFFARQVGATVKFHFGTSGKAKRLTWEMGGASWKARRQGAHE